MEVPSAVSLAGTLHIPSDVASALELAGEVIVCLAAL
jgi:hypothetical protein